MSLTREEKAMAIRQARRLADDFDPNEAEKFAREHRDKVWHRDFSLLLRMLSDPGFTLSAGAWAVLAGALAYVVCPLDVIPDFIPCIAWIDDVFVLGWAMQILSREIAAYRRRLVDADPARRQGGSRLRPRLKLVSSC